MEGESMREIRKFHITGYVDCPHSDSSGFNVHITIVAEDMEQALEKLFSMSPSDFKKQANAYPDHEIQAQVWNESVHDANDAIDWFYDDVEVSELDSKAIAKAFIAKELVSDKMKGCKNWIKKIKKEGSNYE